MTLDRFLSEITQYYSSLYYQAETAGWGLPLIAFALLILLIFILKRKWKTKDVSVIIYHNRQKQWLDDKSDQWEKGKTRIEKLLYEITEHEKSCEYQNALPDLSNNDERHYCDIPIYGRTNKMLRERNVKANKLKKSSSPLDIQELQAVATLAKQLRARSRHSFKT